MKTFSKHNISQFVLGTAQLGMNYGIANNTGMPSIETAKELLQIAKQNGITCLDTAAAYANSEQTLQKSLEKTDDFKIISKINPALSPKDSNSILQGIETSSQLCNGLWGIMFHSEDWIPHIEALWPKLEQAKSKQQFSYFGISVYSPESALIALENPHVDFIQLPLNIWDQRSIQLGVLDLAKETNKLCFVRSIYLQGLLTLPAHIASQKLPQFSAVFNTWETLCSEFKLDSKTIAFEFAKSLNTPLVIGVETVDQLKENISNLEAIQQNIPFQELYEAIQPLLSKELLLPQFWTPPH